MTDNEWAAGDRVCLEPPDHEGRYGRRGSNATVSGRVRGIEIWFGRPAVRVDLDESLNGVDECLASPKELRRAG